MRGSKECFRKCLHTTIGIRVKAHVLDYSLGIICRNAAFIFPVPYSSIPHPPVAHLAGLLNQSRTRENTFTMKLCCAREERNLCVAGKEGKDAMRME